MPKRKASQTVQSDQADLSSLIAMAVSTGKTKFGARSAIKETKGSRPKAVVVADNCPENIKLAINHNASFAGIPIIPYPKSSLELGAVVGRPHRLAVLVIYDPGNSKILDVFKSEKN